MIATVTGEFSGSARANRSLPRVPTPPSGWPIGSYETYAEAHGAVQHLASNDFPVQEVTIVGVDLMLVERVIGRLSWPKVLSTGAIAGAWFGLAMGLLIGLFGQRTTPVAPILVSLLVGVLTGMVFTSVGYVMTRNGREIASASQLVAGRYDVLAQPRNAEKGRDLLAKLAMGSRG
jgi:hypothetical protein